jgi:dephospho-CoA kinase
MIKIGLTGGIGSGKSEAARVLRQLGAVIIEADALAHAAYRNGQPAYRELVDEFGAGIVAPDGEIDRRRLGAIVFSDPARRLKLESIVWPRIADAIAREYEQAQAAGAQAAVLVAAVLFEAGWDRLVDTTWTVEAHQAAVLARIERRDGITAHDARARLAAQLSNTDRRARAKLTIWNEADVPSFERKVREAWESQIVRRRRD